MKSFVFLVYYFRKDQRTGIPRCRKERIEAKTEREARLRILIYYAVELGRVVVSVELKRKEGW